MSSSLVSEINRSAPVTHLVMALTQLEWLKRHYQQQQEKQARLSERVQAASPRKRETSRFDESQTLSVLQNQFSPI
jgi:hypothetical protein